MSIPVVCPSCQSSMKVKDEFAGKRAKCPQCGEPLTVPAIAATPAKMPKRPRPEVIQEFEDDVEPATKPNRKRAKGGKATKPMRPLWQRLLRTTVIAVPATVLALFLCLRYAPRLILGLADVAEGRPVTVSKPPATSPGASTRPVTPPIVAQPPGGASSIVLRTCFQMARV
jgi:hypothetical protein